MKSNPDPLEKDIEKRVCDYAKALKMLCYKFTSPARSHVPDRIFITPTGVVFFIEFKRKGQKPTPAQMVEIEKIRATGVQVYVVDNLSDGRDVIDGVAGRHMAIAVRAVGQKVCDQIDELRKRKADPLADY